MKKVLSLIVLTTIIFSLGCSLDQGSKKSESTTLGISGRISSAVDQIISKDSGSRSAKTFTGILSTKNLETGVVENFDWYVSIDEEAFTMVSNKTIVLNPGNYDLDLAVSLDNHHYVGSTSLVSIKDGENTIDLTLHPVIGDVNTSVNLNQIASLRFEYSTIELSGIEDPKIGISVDSGNEIILDVNKATGISQAYVDLVEGSYHFDLKLYNGNLQIGKSIDAQENVTVKLKDNIKMDLVPLHGEMALKLDLIGGDSTFKFSFPKVIADEVNGLNNLKAIIALTSPVNGNYEQELVLTEENDKLTGSITYNNFRYDKVALAVTFTEISSSETIAMGTKEGIELIEADQSIVIDLRLRRRAAIQGKLLSVLGVNVFNQDNEPVANANVYVNGKLAGITGSGNFGTAGYVKLYIVAGETVISAKTSTHKGSDTITLSPLQVANLDIKLEPKGSIKSIYVINHNANVNFADRYITHLQDFNNMWTVTVHNTYTNPVPTVAQLNNYDIVIYTADYQDTTKVEETCNSIIGYMEGVGNLITRSFASYDPAVNINPYYNTKLQDEYSPVINSGRLNSIRRTLNLDSVVVPELKEGISNAEYGSLNNLTLTADNSRVLGRYNDGSIAIAERTDCNSVTINGLYYQTDPWTLVKNTITYLGSK